ncbi:hypothetical protein [Planomicrobium sp. YIM 101495]|uniref:hypothetical protein n=1 Tax=Planomicrobium sp. YIM 101495 TaxID=2665160 RepID=UPI0012B80336|nr:hypothetical protein [Planomicrobium sp. YIM 101495]MTD30123.1 hypothetical protein [Planomicrobium sp. YIM 101495]
MENATEPVIETTETDAVENEGVTETVDTEPAEVDPLEEAHKQLEQREKELFQREVKAELKENGLVQFAEVVSIADEKELKETIKKLSAIVNDLKVSLSYQPTDNTKQDSYTVAKQNGDSKSMIKALFGNR